MKGIKTTNLYQFQRLVEELRKEPEMARGVPVTHANRQKYKDGWEEIKEMLNFLGPPTRSTAEWKKVWADLRTRTKRKLAEIEVAIRRNSDASSCKVVLTPLEQEVEHLLGLIEETQKAAQVIAPKKRQREEAAPATSSHSADPLQPSAVTDDEEAIVASLDELSSDASSNAAKSPPKRSKPSDDEYLVLLRRQNRLLEENTKALGRIAEAIERLF